MFQKIRRAALLLALAGLQAYAGEATAGDATTDDYSKEAARTSPAWVHDGVIYEIFPREFSATGNFAGVTAQLDRLQQLGVTILWLMPIHPVGKLKSKGTLGSPYAVRDYYSINPEYGTAADLHRLVGEAHRHNLKVIIDVVANHTAWDSVMMRHPEFYEHDANGQIIAPQPDWTDVAHLQYTKAGVPNRALRSYMLDMLVHWLKDFDLDGFRCDYAVGVPTDFWEDAREALGKVKPDILMLAEADAPALLVKAFDVDYAWSLYHAVVDAVQGREPASAVRDSWSSANATYPRGALRMRFADNHDQRRALAQFGEPAALAASALMFTLDGVPLLYNGMEVGDTAESAAPALFEKLPIFWQSADLRPQFPQFFHELIALRAAHPALRSDEVQWLHNSDESRVLTFMRRSAGENLLVAINLSTVPFNGLVAVTGGPYVDLTPSSGTADAAAAVIPADQHAAPLPVLSLAAWQYRVFRAQQ